MKTKFDVNKQAQNLAEKIADLYQENVYGFTLEDLENLNLKLLKLAHELQCCVRRGGQVTPDCGTLNLTADELIKGVYKAVQEPIEV